MGRRYQWFIQSFLNNVSILCHEKSINLHFKNRKNSLKTLFLDINRYNNSHFKFLVRNLLFHNILVVTASMTDNRHSTEALRIKLLIIYLQKLR